MNQYQLTRNADHQQGVVLAITLIMLVLITLLAVSGMRSTIMEERMASNSRNNNIAFQLAETALRKAEFDLQSDVNAIEILTAMSQGVGFGACEVGRDSVDFHVQANWGVACNYVGTAPTGVTARIPQYFIEFLYAAPDLAGGTERDCFYRITAKGFGADTNSNVLLQTTYKFPNCS